MRCKGLEKEAVSLQYDSLVFQWCSNHLTPAFITHSVLLEERESKIKIAYLSFPFSGWQWTVGVKGILSLDNVEKDK